ncbi:protein DENND6A-like [Bolinopsis microptera]|uniref:protein DENND6A-like n=1 Tax=Bolinopsis microptera TaxID=2820187 RepID=UPI003079C30A
MIPLEQYISSLMPLQKQLNPFRQPPLLQQFQQEAFINSLNDSNFKSAELKGLRGSWKELYRKFIKSPNFELWFQSKRTEANQRLELLHVQQLSEADLYSWKTDRHEVEIVDMLLWIRDRHDALQRLGSNPELQDHLKNHIDTLLEVVPADLQSTLKPAFNL